jgi:hypothetical protein
MLGGAVGWIEQRKTHRIGCKFSNYLDLMSPQQPDFYLL